MPMIIHGYPTLLQSREYLTVQCRDTSAMFNPNMEAICSHSSLIKKNVIDVYINNY